MISVPVVEAKKQFGDLMARVAYSGQRLIVERHGRPMMAWISMEDLQHLEALERDVEDVRARRRAALTLATASRQRVTVQRGGKSLPDSADVLNQLREERMDDFSGLR